MTKIFFKNFINFYRKNSKINLYITTGLIFLQVFHLFWLTLDVVAYRLFNESFLELGETGKILISIVDLLEIPTIITVSILYLQEIYLHFSFKKLYLLLFINSQWLHIFWITDEIILAQFTGQSPIILPIWLSWIAIIIDYLELPVIYDLTKRSIISIRNSLKQEHGVGKFDF